MAPPAVEYICKVKNLSPHTTDESLKKEFSVFGKVYTAEVRINPVNGVSKGIGYVTFSKEKAMKDAIDTMDGHKLDGHTISVYQVQSKGNNDGGGARPQPEGVYRCHVSKLQPSTNEQSLLVAFSKFGTVKPEIKYNKETGESLKFGFVTFRTENAMKKAIDEMDGEMIDRRCIAVKQDGTTNDSDPVEVGYECKVGNLSSKTSGQSLKNAFKRFGKIIGTEIDEEFNKVKNEYISKGIGYVTFSTEKEMNFAIQEMNGKKLPNLYFRSITVTLSERKRNNNGDARPQYECYVKKLQYFTTEETLKKAFSKFGTVLRTRIATGQDDEYGVYCRGFGFVSFATEKAMKDAIDGMDGEMLDSRSIVVQQSQSKGNTNDGVPVESAYKCIVRNLSYTTSERTLREVFSKFGNVLETKIVEAYHYETGEYSPKGYGFVSFSTENEMNDAIQGLNGEELDGRYITVNQAQPRRARTLKE